MSSDRDADFEQFAASRWPRLVRTARTLGCPEHAAEDAAQAALIRCWRHWRRVSNADDVDAYVFRILLNAVHAHLHKHPARAVHQQDSERPLETAIRPEVVEAINALPLQQREVIVLRCLADFDVRRTALTLQVPEGTVKSRLARALDTLRSTLDPTTQRIGTHVE